MFDKIKALFYRPEFFKAQTFDGGVALRFYTLSVLVFAVAMVALMAPGAWRFVQSFKTGEWQKQETVLKNLYPTDVEVTFKNGEISTNASEPVVIPFPREWRVREISIPKNLLIIDTAMPITLADFEAKDTLAILGKSEAGFRNPERGEVRIFNLRENNPQGSFVLTERLYMSFIERASEIAQAVIVAGMFVLPSFMFVAFWIAYLVYALLGALVVWLAASLRGHQLTYARAYFSTLYLLPAPFLASILLSASGTRPPLLFTLALFLMALVNFPKSEKLPAPVKIATTDSSVTPIVVGLEKKQDENTQ